MRLLAGLFVMIVLVLAFGLWTSHALDKASQELTGNIKQVTQEVQQDNWQEANKHVEELEQKWEKIGTWWPMVLDHQEIDNIEFALAKLKEYIATKDNVMSLAQLSELKLMILHLPEKEALTLKNIL
ncbi:DUF4363 family protein [Desulforamulus aeronauticus]|uniref:DUF4363 family protein n=1 Tax=Desulforamulus aeronauticus DSM 10349 TaxID=1121421 RepID=A0A1M6NXG8_9FIRM|nr:DUF4363 family protein [Desulforamulus aeronauticus]SHK00362.1 protein of unknown function [Desulforamulus aeronauticus DSM 10349]